MSPQIFRIPVSSAQRFILFSLTHDQGQNGQSGKFRISTNEDSIKYRRFCDAFKLKVIGKVGKKHGAFSVSHVLDETPYFLEVTIDNIEFALARITVLDRNAAQEDVIGSLFDVFDAAKAGKYVEDEHKTTEDGDEVKEFDEIADRKAWVPKQPESASTPSAEQPSPSVS